MIDRIFSRVSRRAVAALVAAPLFASCGTPWFIARPAPPSAMTRTTPVPPSLELFHAPSVLKDSTAIPSRADASDREARPSGV